MKVHARASAVAAVVALWSPATAARAMAPAGECRAAHLNERPVGLPPAWQVALAELIAATAETGQPWSCSNALLALRLDGSGAELVVTTPDGRVARRRVATPDDLPAQGEALLALPTFAAPPSAAPDAPVALPAPPADRAPTSPREPRLLVDAFAGPRFTGPSGTAWATVGVRGTIPIGAWGASLWGRYAQPVATLGDEYDTRDLGTSEVELGLGLSRRFSAGRFALDVSLDPALAVVSMERDHNEMVRHEEGARVALRLGVGARAHYRLSRIFNVTLGVDGEVSPQDLGGARKIAPDFPPIPAYGAGLTIGVEAEIP